MIVFLVENALAFTKTRAYCISDSFKKTTQERKKPQPREIVWLRYIFSWTLPCCALCFYAGIHCRKWVSFYLLGF